MRRKNAAFTVMGASLLTSSWARVAAQCLPDPPGAIVTAEPQGVFVQWTGVGGCPTPDVDFTVDSSEPPNVVLKTLAVGGFPIDQWFVGRTLSEGLQPRDLQSVKSDWTGEQANPGIIVRIGTVSGYPVRSIVGTPAPERISVDIKRPPVVNGNDPWSSVQIQTMKNFILQGGDVSGSVLVEASNASPPAGGRIRGNIAGNQGQAGMVDDDDPRIQAFAIGEGSGAGGVTQTLRVSGNFWNGRLKEFPSNARLEIGKMTTGSLLNIKGPLNGTIRLQYMEGFQNSLQPTKIVAEALNLAAGDPPPPNEPRLPSSGKVIIAYEPDLSDDFFPCEECDTTGWPTNPPYIGWRNSEIWIKGDFACQVYAWDGDFGGNEYLQTPKVTIGDTTLPGKLKAGGAIRTFSGAHSSPPHEGTVTNFHVDVFGDTEPGSLIDIAGQWGAAEYINVWGDHHGDIRVMYFYGSYGPEQFNATVHVHGHMYGLVESANLTATSQNSGFRDNGTIIVEGDLKDTGRIQLTGHVGPQHLTEIMGNMYGRYYAYGGVQKKYAGRLRVHGSVIQTTAVPIEIESSIDSMTYNSFTQMKGAEITIDGDLLGPMKLGGINAPLCAWTCPELDPYDHEVCGCQNPPTCSEVSGCSGPPDCSALYPASCLDDDWCSLACSCLPAPDEACNAQSSVIREDQIQHPGSLVNGSIIIGGRLTSTINVPGHIGASGSISVGQIVDGGGISLSNSSGITSSILPGGRLTVVGGFTSGEILVPGGVSGPITIGSLGPSTGGGSNQASISIGGELRSTITVRDQMHAALISVGTGATGSRINLGTSSTLWTVVDGPGGTGYIDIGDINWSGGSSTIITFRGSYTSPPSGMAAPRSICWGTPAGTVLQLFSGDPMPAAICLP